MAIQHARNRAFESSTLPIVVMDPVTYRFLDCNPAAAAVYGYPGVTETLGKTPLDVSVEVQYDGTPSPEKARYFIEKALAEGSVVFEWHHMRPDGTQWDAEVHLMRFVADDTELLQFTLFNITARKTAENALKESESRFRVLFEHAGVAIVVFDSKKGFVDCNQKALELFGCTADQLLGESPFRFSPATQPNGRGSEELIRENIAAAVANGPQFFDWVHRRFDGTPIETETALSVVRTEHGMVIFGIVRDVTDRNRAAQEKANLQAQLLQAQKMEAIGRLAGGVAHDFNNLLGVILGRTDLILDEIADDHPLRKNLLSIQDATERSAALTGQLLAFARKQPVAPRALSINEKLGGMLDMLRRLIGEQIELIWRPGSDLANVNIDPSQLDQILANLSVNARDAIEGVGKVVIETANVDLDETCLPAHSDCKPGAYVMLVISDNGCGMSKEVLDRVFDPFYTTKTVGEGSGLGLSTVYGIVRQNGGFIQVYSEPEQGAAFKIYLPQSAISPKSRRPSRTDTPLLGRGETVLLVEDEPHLCELARDMLEKLGFTVLAAGLPSEAIALCTGHPGKIVLLVTDVIMPEMNGRELKDKLCEFMPGLPCLFISGYTDDVIAHHGVLDAGVHFLTKPFTLKDLSAMVFEILA